MWSIWRIGGKRMASETVGSIQIMFWNLFEFMSSPSSGSSKSGRTDSWNQLLLVERWQDERRLRCQCRYKLVARAADEKCRPRRYELVDQSADEMRLLSGLAFDIDFSTVFARFYASVNVYRSVGSCFEYKVDVQ